MQLLHGLITVKIGKFPETNNIFEDIFWPQKPVCSYYIYFFIFNIINPEINNQFVYNLNQYSVFHDCVFESLFIEITDDNNQKIVIGSVYRPGTICPGLNFTEQFA